METNDNEVVILTKNQLNRLLLNARQLGYNQCIVERSESIKNGIRHSKLKKDIFKIIEKQHKENIQERKKVAIYRRVGNSVLEVN